MNEPDENHDAAGAQPSEPHAAEPDTDQGWELWSKVAMMMLATAVVAWGVVFLRLGEPSVFTHAFVVSTLGVMTVPVILWGLVKALFNRPLMRRSRVIAFASLLAIAYFGNVPLFPAPLSTEGWQSEHTYRLPFEGEWAVTAGGETMETNYHATTATYRWGYDFTKTRDGKRHTGDGKKVTDYFCYGQPVLAPAPGEVVEADSGHPDNTPGEFDPDTESVMGNHVIIKVDEGEYLFVAQMKEGSMAVDKGDEVARGQKIGECGNSGRSLQPHLHVHLQNSKKFPLGESLPLHFSDYAVTNGKSIEEGMPLGSSSPDEPFGLQVRNKR